VSRMSDALNVNVKSERTFLFRSLIFPKELVSLSGKGNMKMRMSIEHWWNNTDRGNRATGRKTCPSTTLSTTNVTGTDLGSSPGLRGERPATNRQSHGTARKV
jgi:hypothetical protein